MPLQTTHPLTVASGDYFVGPGERQSHDRRNSMIRHGNEELPYRLLRLIDQ